MKEHPLKQALELYNKGFIPKYIDFYQGHYRYYAQQGSYHVWVGEKVYRLMRCLEKQSDETLKVITSNLIKTNSDP